MIYNKVRQLVHGFYKDSNYYSHFYDRDRLDGASEHYRDYPSIYYKDGKQLLNKNRMTILKRANKNVKYKMDII